MSLRKRLKEIKQDTENIEKKIDDITAKTFWKAKEYDRITEKLSHIKVNVKDCQLFLQDDGTVGVKVTYDFPLVKVFFDGDGEPIRNERFASINELNIISFEDQKKLIAKMTEAREKNKLGKE